MASTVSKMNCKNSAIRLSIMRASLIVEGFLAPSSKPHSGGTLLILLFERTQRPTYRGRPHTRLADASYQNQTLPRDAALFVAIH